jgi:hypothetical protein
MVNNSWPQEAYKLLNFERGGYPNKQAQEQASSNVTAILQYHKQN